VNRILCGLGGLAVAATAACGGSNTPNDRFIKDAAAHGVPHDKSMVTNGLHQTMAEAACSHIKDSKDPGSAVAYLVSIPAGFTENQAKVTTYWAAKDVCPDELGLIKDSWKDAVNNPNPSG
jgi:hypothetical protein